MHECMVFMTGTSLLTKKLIETLTEFVMVLMAIMGIGLLVTETVMVPVGLYW